MEELSRDVSGGTEEQDTTNTCIYDQETSMNNCVKACSGPANNNPSAQAFRHTGIDPTAYVKHFP